MELREGDIAAGLSETGGAAAAVSEQKTVVGLDGAVMDGIGGRGIDSMSEIHGGTGTGDFYGSSALNKGTCAIASVSDGDSVVGGENPAGLGNSGGGTAIITDPKAFDIEFSAVEIKFNGGGFAVVAEIKEIVGDVHLPTIDGERGSCIIGVAKIEKVALVPADIDGAFLQNNAANSIGTCTEKKPSSGACGVNIERTAVYNERTIAVSPMTDIMVRGIRVEGSVLKEIHFAL